jgi:predicted nuclease with TOPRIM domain
MILKKELIKKVEELEGDLKVAEDEVKRYEEIRDRLSEENQKLQHKVESLEQIIPAEELGKLDDNTIYRLCDPEMMVFHKRRDMGIDIYCESERDDKKWLLTRIPLSLAYETWDSMTLSQKAERIQPLVEGIETAYKDHSDYHIYVEASVTKTVYAW